MVPPFQGLWLVCFFRRGVAQKDGELIVVEVKTRRNEEFGKPEEAIT